MSSRFCFAVCTTLTRVDKIKWLRRCHRGKRKKRIYRTIEKNIQVANILYRVSPFYWDSLSDFNFLSHQKPTCVGSAYARFNVDRIYEQLFSFLFYLFFSSITSISKKETRKGRERKGIVWQQYAWTTYRRHKPDRFIFIINMQDIYTSYVRIIAIDLILRYG